MYPITLTPPQSTPSLYLIAPPLFPWPKLKLRVTLAAEDLKDYTSGKYHRGIYHCQPDTPTEMNWVKWKQCTRAGPTDNY